jgi:hypothetical protein
VSLGVLILIALLTAVSCRVPEDQQTIIPFNQDLARQAGKTLPGTTYENREKIRQAMAEKDLLAALGKPTEKLESKGLQLSGRYTYLYADGKIVVTLRDGIVVDVETTFY